MSLGRARAAVSAVFFVHGVAFASWAARVPEVGERLHLAPGVLGLVLAGPGLGALAGSQFGGLLVNRVGSRAASALVPLLLCAPLGALALATGPAALFVLLLLLGVGDGATSVAMSAQGVALQDACDRPMLNSLHAVRSLGAVAGSLFGAATVGWNLTLQFAVAASSAAALSIAAQPALLPDSSDGPRTPDDAPPRGRRLAARRALLRLATMAFLASLIEDAPASWGGVYLRSTGAGPALAASAYAAFSAGEVTSRLLNDRVVRRSGWVRVIRVGTLVCAFALALALPCGRPWVSLAALALAGAGISAVFPGAYATAGTMPSPATAMAQVSFAGSAGWLLVSPIVGALTIALGLTAALGVLPVAALVVAALADVTSRAGHSSAADRRGPARSSRASAESPPGADG